MLISDVECLPVDAGFPVGRLQYSRHARRALRHLGIIGGQPSVEHQDELVLPHGHLVRVEEPNGIGLHPDKVIPEPPPIGVDEVGGEWLSGGDNRGTVGFQNSIELLPHEVEVWANVPGTGSDAVRRVREDEIDGTVGDSLDAGFVVLQEDMVEERFWEHGNSLAIY